MVGTNTLKSFIDEIVLIGGSTHIPKVQVLIKEFFYGKEPSTVNPEEASGKFFVLS
jgi:heat shock protein 5